MLLKRVGDFSLTHVEKGKTLKESIQNSIKRIKDIEIFYHDYKMGHAEEKLLIHYDYADGGIGSTGLCIIPDFDLDRFYLKIVIYSELDGHTEYDSSFAVWELMDGGLKEEEILEKLYDVLNTNTIEYKKLLI